MKYIGMIIGEYGKVKEEISLPTSHIKVSTIQKGTYLIVEGTEYYISEVLTDIDNDTVYFKLLIDSVPFFGGR